MGRTPQMRQFWNIAQPGSGNSSLQFFRGRHFWRRGMKHGALSCELLLMPRGPFDNLGDRSDRSG